MTTPQDFSGAREYYVSKLEGEKERWGVKCIDVEVIDTERDYVIVSSLWDSLRQGLGLKFWIGRIDGESVGLIVSESEVPRPVELLQLFELICDLDTFAGSQEELADVLDGYDGPYKVLV